MSGWINVVVHFTNGNYELAWWPNLRFEREAGVDYVIVNGTYFAQDVVKNITTPTGTTEVWPNDPLGLVTAKESA